MGNLFLDAMGTDKVNEINKIKANKKFGLRLIDDLGSVFNIYPKIEDDTQACYIDTKSRPNHNYYSSNRFVCTKDGVMFESTLLCYQDMKSFDKYKGLPTPISLYKKYLDQKGTKADTSFLDEKHKHGKVTICIRFDENNPNLKEILKDITAIYEYDGYTKKF